MKESHDLDSRLLPINDSRPPADPKHSSEQPRIQESRANQGNSLRADSFQLTAMLWLAGICGLAVLPTTLMDVSIASFLATHPLPTSYGEVIELAAEYGNGIGITLIIVAVVVLSRRRRWSAPRLVTLAAGGGAVATIAKLFVLRPRPNSLPLEWLAQDIAWIWSFDPTLSQLASFEPATRAFPSASLASATAMTVGIWMVVPKFRYLASVLCVATMLQQIECGAHFASDLFGSAAVGLAWSYICFHPSWLGGIFDRLEPELPPYPESANPSKRQVDQKAKTQTVREAA
ncbi:MAG: phosphatase PAP2 family protein [Planctomycetota bacterium]